MKITLLILLYAANSFADSRNGSPVEGLLTEDAIRTLRDPFQAPPAQLRKKEAPTSELELISLSDLVINGVIIDAKKKAKAMLSVPNGKTFFVVEGTRVGKRDGHVTAISGDAINVVEYDYDERGKKIPRYYRLSISGELVSLMSKEQL